MFLSGQFRPSNLIQVFGFADDYSFGILQFQVHWLWFTTKCGTMKSDPRYSAESVFDTNIARTAKYDAGICFCHRANSRFIWMGRCQDASTKLEPSKNGDLGAFGVSEGPSSLHS